MGILFGFICLAIAVPIGLAIGAVILRAAVSISNKILGPKSSVPYDEEDFEDDDYDDEDEDEDDRPRRRKRRPSRSTAAIPEPSFGRAMLIILVAGIINFAISFVLVLALTGGMPAGGGMNAINPEDRLLINAISLPVSFLILSGICTAMLPTSFGRACLVALFYNLVVLFIVAVIFGILMLAGFALFNAGR